MSPVQQLPQSGRKFSSHTTFFRITIPVLRVEQFLSKSIGDMWTFERGVHWTALSAGPIEQFVG